MSNKDMTIPIDPTQAKCTFMVAEKLKHLSQLRFGKIEAKSNPVISKELEIEANPRATKVLFKNGKVVDTIRQSEYEPART